MSLSLRENAAAAAYVDGLAHGEFWLVQCASMIVFYITTAASPTVLVQSADG